MKNPFMISAPALTLATAAVVLTATFAIAQQGTPGGHFIENWDPNEDGAVTLAEATERRSDIFFTFDQDDNGVLTAEEYELFDNARALDHENDKGGQGHGGGHGNGQGGGKNGEGMAMAFNDINGDGQVTRDEFMARTGEWYAKMDRNGDGVITTKDFGRRG